MSIGLNKRPIPVYLLIFFIIFRPCIPFRWHRNFAIVTISHCVQIGAGRKWTCIQAQVKFNFKHNIDIYFIAIICTFVINSSLFSFYDSVWLIIRKLKILCCTLNNYSAVMFILVSEVITVMATEENCDQFHRPILASFLHTGRSAKFYGINSDNANGLASKLAPLTRFKARRSRS